MAVETVERGALIDLSESEMRALTQAASWYASYHSRIIAEQADDPSAAAVARRDGFLDLYAALSKLGIRLRLPDELIGRQPG